MEKRELVQKLAVQAIQESDYTGLFVIAPRVGKTKIAIDAVKENFSSGWNVAVVVPRQDILSTWRDECFKWGMYDYDDKNDRLHPRMLCFASLKKIPENLDLLIVDEPQALSIAQMEWIKKKNPKRLLMLTGTANQHTRGKLLYQLGIKGSRFEYTIEEAIKDGIIANFHVYIVKVPMNNVDKTVTIKVNGRPSFKITERQNYLYLSEMFDSMRIEAKINPSKIKAKEMFSRKRANAIYNGVTKKELARQIQERISQRLLIFTTRTEVADYISPYSYHSKSKGENNLERFIEGEINTLSVVQMSDMGITFPDLKLELIHQLQSNSETSIQKFLRTCNLEGEKEAVVLITVYKDTMDESWANQAIEGVPEDKVTWVELEELDELVEKLR